MSRGIFRKYGISKSYTTFYFYHRCPCVLLLAAALYYLAELVEEYTVMAKKVIMLLIMATFTIYLGLMIFEKLPWTLILTGFAAQAVHGWIMKSFPFVRISSPEFISAVILVIVNHFFAFRFFAKNYYPLAEVLAFFTLCLWIVPFALFVSLSANDQVLPTTMSSSSAEQSPLLHSECRSEKTN